MLDNTGRWLKDDNGQRLYSEYKISKNADFNRLCELKEVKNTDTNANYTKNIHKEKEYER